MEQTVKKFKDYCEKIRAYDHAMGILSYDSETVMPASNAENFSSTCSILSGESYKLTVAQEFKDLVNAILSQPDKVDFITRREAEELKRDMERMERIPIDEYMEFVRIQSLAVQAWFKAKNENDYDSFEPHLAKIVELSRRFVGYTDPGRDPYNAMLGRFERGLTTDTLDVFFDKLYKSLTPLVLEIGARGKKLDTSFIHKNYSIPRQRELSKYLMEIMGLPMERCVLGEVEHPFTTSFTKQDVRITTHYYENMMASNIFSVIHEGGHAMYMACVSDELQRSPLGDGASMSIHESQSRLYENIIGRSEAFVNLIFPKVKELFPEQLKDVDAHMFYLAVNESKPSLIRIEADELTYPMHIMVRYEIEKQLVAGTLGTKELPEAWNAMYKRFLGVDVPDNKHGVLQDSHWSGGSIGYFPSYALGSAYGAQIYASMLKDVDAPACIANGDLIPVREWLTEKIFRHGATLTPAEIIQNSCGAPFDPNFYIDYLTNKYRGIYGL